MVRSILTCLLTLQASAAEAVATHAESALKTAYASQISRDIQSQLQQNTDINQDRWPNAYKTFFVPTPTTSTTSTTTTTTTAAATDDDEMLDAVLDELEAGLDLD
jgi:hypothetical protein